MRVSMLSWLQLKPLLTVAGNLRLNNREREQWVQHARQNTQLWFSGFWLSTFTLAISLSRGYPLELEWVVWKTFQEQKLSWETRCSCVRNICACWTSRSFLDLDLVLEYTCVWEILVHNMHKRNIGKWHFIIFIAWCFDDRSGINGLVEAVKGWKSRTGNVSSIGPMNVRVHSNKAAIVTRMFQHTCICNFWFTCPLSDRAIPKVTVEPRYLELG